MRSIKSLVGIDHSVIPEMFSNCSPFSSKISYSSINKQLAGPHKDPPCMNVVAKQMEVRIELTLPPLF